MTRNFRLSSKQIASAALAVVLTFVVHGGWLSGLDRDAAVTIASVDVA